MIVCSSCRTTYSYASSSSSSFSTFFFFLLLLLKYVACDFLYADFNETTGLRFNGAAGTSSCWDDPLKAYGDVQGLSDLFNAPGVVERQETTDEITESLTETFLQKDNYEIETSLAGFLHRRGTLSSPTNCDQIRARLTPSNPTKVGSVWYREEVPINNGFDTYFTFQITDHSKECTLHRDQYFTPVNHRTCSVHGADGFAFVIQRESANSTDALGQNGGQIGFGGIANSIAIAFDTWQNPGLDQIHRDHVSVQSKGVLPNDAFSGGLLGVPRAHDLADGAVHLVRIVYYGELKSQYLSQLSASTSLLPYLLDNGEQKRVGTLLVFIDEGISTDTPLIAMPINLSLLLYLPTDKAFVGFTSATGRFYEKHDILSWIWCDQEPCDTPDVANRRIQKQPKSTFDYHQTSKFSSVSVRRFDPNTATGFFGGGDNYEFPSKNKNPDTTAWSVPSTTFSLGSLKTKGLNPGASMQVPPNTLY